jgi:hypothetical protein
MKIKKLSLKADELRVESFDTLSGAAGRGTVFGHDCPTYSCEGTCGASPPPSDTTLAAEAIIRPTRQADTCLVCCV